MATVHQRNNPLVPELAQGAADGFDGEAEGIADIRPAHGQVNGVAILAPGLGALGPAPSLPPSAPDRRSDREPRAHRDTGYRRRGIFRREGEFQDAPSLPHAWYL